jgi:hypothetical protein
MARPKARKPNKPVPNPTNTKVDAKSITKMQIARLRALAREAGDHPMIEEIRILNDKKASAARRRRALDECVRLHNDLISIASK